MTPGSKPPPMLRRLGTALELDLGPPAPAAAPPPA